MAKHSTFESLTRDIEITKAVAREIMIDFSRLKMAVAGLAALALDLAKELQEYIPPEPAEPESIGPPDTSDGN